MVRTKQMARERVYWPGLGKQIEEMVSRCGTCLQFRNNQTKEPMTIHPIPPRPWAKVGTDLCELGGQNYLVMVDYFSNFIELANLEGNTTASNVIRHIKQNVARYGIMDTLMSDNGPQYSCKEFAEFTDTYHIKHVTSSPQHPQCNGLAEKAVQTVKNILKKCQATGEDIHLALLDLRNTPRDGEIGSPMQRLMGRRAQTQLPSVESLLKQETVNPETVHDKLMQYRKLQKYYHDKRSRTLGQIGPTDGIRVSTPKGWQPAELMREHQMPKSYVIKAGGQGRTYRRNRHELMVTREPPHVVRPTPQTYVPPPRRRTVTGDCNPLPVAEQRQPNSNDSNPTADALPNVARPPAPLTTRSGRQVNPPSWMKDMVSQ